MLTNKIFDTFLGVLQQQKTRPHIASLAEGHRFWQDLEKARLEFEYALSEKLLALATEKQIELITQILTLFKSSGLLLSQPAYLWHVEKLSDTGLVWYREANEPPSVKAFRDECERRISIDPEKFLAPIQAFSQSAKEATQFLRLVINPGAIGVFDEIELDYDETDLHLEAARWIQEGLSAKVGIEAQENVRQHFEKLAGKEAAAHWIIKPEKWYDTYREIQGLPPIQAPFQHSYEAWDFYFSDLKTTPAALDYINEAAPTRSNPPPSESTYPWERIEALAEQIGLRKHGRFTPSSNKIAAAASGFIDALREAEILSQSVNLPILHQDFSTHYSQKIKADRVTDTRLDWQSKARTALGLH
jgi:hypothetical protein